MFSKKEKKQHIPETKQGKIQQRKLHLFKED